MSAPFWTPVTDQRVVEMFAANHDDTAIAAELGSTITACAIKRRRHKLGLRRQPHRFPKKETPTPRPDIKKFDTRHAAMITTIIALVPLGMALGDVVTIAGRELTVIAYSPSGELVTVDRTCGGGPVVVVRS